MIITDIRREYAREIAALHVEGIKTGFISSLGIGFVTSLYEAIAQSDSGFGFVAKENNRVLGFAAFTTDINKLYRTVILRRGLRFMLLLAGKMLSLSRLRNTFETLFYPARIKKLNLPCAELLSIVIAEESRRKGLAAKLIQTALGECARRQIEKVKVIVGADNMPANKLYLACGFELAGQTRNHGILSNIYLAKTNAKKNGTDS